MKLHILKITDREDRHTDESYFTIKGLREQVLNEWYDIWSERYNEYWEGEQDYSKEDIANSDEHLLDYMDSWGYNVEVIYTITEKDLN
jgi:hypothetical protein